MIPNSTPASKPGGSSAPLPRAWPPIAADDLPANILIKAILPEPVGGPGDNRPRRFYVYPGGTVPRVGVLLANRTGAQRLVRIDPITGAPRIERSTGETVNQ